jgi:hypothetical protein
MTLSFALQLEAATAKIQVSARAVLAGAVMA